MQNTFSVYAHSHTLTMGDLAVDRPAWWRWAYLGLWQSSGQLQMISPTLARWHWAYLGGAMLKPAKLLIRTIWIKAKVSRTERGEEEKNWKKKKKKEECFLGHFFLPPEVSQFSLLRKPRRSQWRRRSRRTTGWTWRPLRRSSASRTLRSERPVRS